MACLNLGNFSVATDAHNLCYSARTTTLYGQGLTITSQIFLDSGCTVPYATSYFSDGTNLYYTNSSNAIERISGCCSSNYCIQNDTTYDGNYQIIGVYNDNPYYSGLTTGYFIFYSTGETRWCLSQTLGGACDQFGPYGSTAICPDFDDTVGYTGTCVTTTTTTSACSTLDFDAVFDCNVLPTPSVTPTNTPTPTRTPTPTPSSPCGGRSMSASIVSISSTPTPTPTPTPSRSPQVTRPCVFSGEVIFNTISEVLQCANSKKFKDCFTGIEYYTSDLVLVSGSTSPKEGYVYNAIINGQGYCVIYEGLFENISGVDNIQLTNEIGSANDGSCLYCTPNITQTPTPTPTSTPTPTPSSTPCVLYKYYVSNTNPVSVTVTSYTCDGKTVINTVSRNTSKIICSSQTPTTSSLNVQITTSGLVC